MPELPEASAFIHLIQSGKGFPGSHKRYKSLKFIVQIIPLCLSLGSPKRSFQSLSASNGDYRPSPNQNHDINWLPPEWPPHSWRKVAQNRWSHLLDPPQQAGEIICSSRGKLLVIAAGNHAVCISLGLEAHIFGMSHKDFFEIIENDRAGPNKNATKAEQIRTFIIPERLIVPNSSNKRPRTIKIFAAFISKDWVYVLSDFSGLVRMFVSSKDTKWTSNDLAPGTTDWNHLFDAFKGGPDWMLERPLAMSAIKTWRATILEERRRWQLRVQDLQKSYEKVLQDHKTTRCLEFYFKPNSGKITTPDPPDKPTLPPQPLRPIIKEICANSLGAFSGFGRHTANDFLFLQSIFPGMPSHLLCESDDIFQNFVSAIEEYLKSFTTDAFFKRIVSVTNSTNPFEFNDESNTQYMKRHILVFRRAKAKVEESLYLDYCKLGLLDPEHTIGEVYPEEKFTKAIKNVKTSKWVSVYLYDGIRAYSIIRARCPPNWIADNGDLTKQQVGKDISTFGYSTTIGLAQFHEPRKQLTGKKGRPPLTKSTKKAQRLIARNMSGRTVEHTTGLSNIFLLDDLSESDLTDLTSESDSEATDREDELDNAGDADIAGDGSGFPSAKPYEEYDNENISDDEFPDEASAFSLRSTGRRLLPTDPDLPIKDLENVLRDARYVVQRYPFSNPYNRPITRQEPGIMTYQRACRLLQNWDSLDLKNMAPYISRRRHHGTTIPGYLADPPKFKPFSWSSQHRTARQGDVRSHD